MDTYKIGKTENTPEVELNHETGIFEIKGISRPENVQDFYDPILEWLENYLKESKNTSLIFNLYLEYFNSSSAKYILIVLKKMIKFIENGINVTVNWSYDNGDEDMLEVGEEMQSLVKFKFNFIELP